MRALLVMVLATLAFAGCSDGGSNSDDSTATTTPTPTGNGGPNVTPGEGTMLVSAGGLTFGQGGLDVDVGDTVTLLYAEIRWADTVQDLNLGVRSPTYDYTVEGGGPGSPDSPHSLAVQSPEEGTWSATAFANPAAVGVTYDLAITLFHGEKQVPDGYTAFAA